MYSKIVYGLALTAAGCHAAEIVRRDADGGGHAHGGGGHAHAPASGYEEPAASYGAPAASYGAPAASYGAPAASYGAPSTGYAEPSTGYGGGGSSYDAAPSYGGDGDILPFDLSALLIPILAIIGLSLLFPTITSVAVNGRRKRDLARGKFKRSCCPQSFLQLCCLLWLQTNTLRQKSCKTRILIHMHNKQNILSAIKYLLLEYVSLPIETSPFIQS